MTAVDFDVECDNLIEATGTNLKRRLNANKKRRSKNGNKQPGSRSN